MEHLLLPLPEQCSGCKHFSDVLHGDEQGGEYFTCKAFPKGIPDEITNGDFDHRKPFKGDNGIQFEAI